jgi:hypothetical protein
LTRKKKAVSVSHGTCDVPPDYYGFIIIITTLIVIINFSSALEINGEKFFSVADMSKSLLQKERNG